jgi:hypothetical protein
MRLPGQLLRALTNGRIFVRCRLHFTDATDLEEAGMGSACRHHDRDAPLIMGAFGVCNVRIVNDFKQ